MPFYHCVTWARVAFFQRRGCDEDHDHREAAEGHACPANSDRHTPRVWCRSESSACLTERYGVTPHRGCAVVFLFSGSSQGAEQRHHQRCIFAALQGPGQTFCLLQRRHHQPIRSVHLRLEDVSIMMALNVRPYAAEKYFKMKKSDCKEALEIYKRFLTRVTKIGEFMKLAEVRQPYYHLHLKWCQETGFNIGWTLFLPSQTVGVDKNDIPDINYVSQHVLQHSFLFQPLSRAGTVNRNATNSALTHTHKHNPDSPAIISSPSVSTRGWWWIWQTQMIRSHLSKAR